MITVLSSFPGNKVTIFLEVVDGYVRIDSLTTPLIDGIIYPDFSAAPGFPQYMSRLDVGLYYFQFTIPTGASAVGSYLIDTSYTYQDGYSNSQLFQVIVNAPFGNYGTSIK